MEIPYTVEVRPDTGIYNAKLGIWLFLASEVMLFGGLFSAYVLLRVGAEPGTWPHGWQNVALGTTNTIVLALSAITTLLAWVSCKVGQFGRFKFFHACTLLLAATFLCIKVVEYHEHLNNYEIYLTNGQIADGQMVENDPKHDYLIITGREVTDESALIDLRSQKYARETTFQIPRSEIKVMQNYGPWHNDYLALYFTLTGLHALHILAGSIVIGYLWGPGRKLWKTDPARFTNRVEVSGLFWHFVDLIWIFLFPVLYLT
ncbi:MAG: heme-copper oxidase subunit III [Verrucomicrobiota bacterium]|nr:heme-copper oxidase subunit III [Verrucomicrobiota bacterium]